MTEEPAVLDAPEIKEFSELAADTPYNVVVWNDPINTMDFVVYVFQQVLSMPKEAAERHMMEVHIKGKSIVFSGTKEKAEHFLFQLLSFHLQTTLEKQHD